MRTLLYKLAHRLITSSSSPSHLSPDRFHLHISILRELELYDEAHTLLDNNVGKQICSTSLLCNEVRRDIWRLKGLWKEEGVRAEERIVDKKYDAMITYLNNFLTHISSLVTEIGLSFFQCWMLRSAMLHYSRARSPARVRELAARRILTRLVNFLRKRLNMMDIMTDRLL
jgi:hypothetical protein